jgi:hypothetical protein
VLKDLSLGFVVGLSASHEVGVPIPFSFRGVEPCLGFAGFLTPLVVAGFALRLKPVLGRPVLVELVEGLVEATARAGFGRCIHS